MALTRAARAAAVTKTVARGLYLLQKSRPGLRQFVMSQGFAMERSQLWLMELRLGTVVLS